MKISRLFNESKMLSKIFYPLFRLSHFYKKKYFRKPFKLNGNGSTRFFIPFHCIPENNLYSHAEIIGSVLGYKKIENFHIQHGVIFGDLVQNTMLNSYADTIVTYSEKRKELISKHTNKKVIAIGPYINYTENRLTIDEFQTLKKKIGKTLLVFPAHSPVNRASVNYDHNDFIQEVLRIKKVNNVQTVLVNLFFTDLKESIRDHYRDYGLEICSAGNWVGSDFLNNLRTIIDLADLTMSNKVGTHIGYCVALKKPHYLYQQKTQINFFQKKDNAEELQYKSHIVSAQQDINRIEQTFNCDKFVIEKKHTEIVNEFWGNPDLNSRDIKHLF